MCDFDLSQALKSSPESDETRFESCCRVQDGQDRIFTLDEGLDLMVSHNPMTMQCLATLLVAINRMKKPLTRCGRQLSGDELCSTIMDSLVDEIIVEKTENSSMNLKKIYNRADSVKLFTLCDLNNKDVVCDAVKLKLKAITLQGGNGEYKVNFKLSKYITADVSAEDGQAVVLSITNNNFHISCSMEGNKAELNLEECSEEGLNWINDDGDMDRFLFFKRSKGKSCFTFESVKCRGWYISTYEGENQPVEMCCMDTCRRYTNFKMN
ncbi:interleukin-1 beta isoform X2 [Siniperca chuatsi]|nr:interleukin-1 beta isoform X2 [Siniperca chuatsi]XP_044029666.1 interleukin-1 beta isoform X2 [Siniperca chuatsi]XP_044029667.1 interleukin-1 beta isoform X2 [Siniperca chuatsi]